MNASSPVIPTGPLPHPAMDYAALRSEALELLGRLSGNQWTDYNVHDPGITILEQLCYAITDLAYRSDFPIADLIASSGGGDPWPPPAERILRGDPVTTEDLRELLRSAGATALRIEPLEASALRLYFHERDSGTGSGELRLEPPTSDPNAQPLRLVGLRQVLVQPTAILPEVERLLHQARLLGEDFELKGLDPFRVAVFADLEVAAVDDPEGLVLEILQNLQATIAPDADLAAAAGIRSSDLLHAILDLPPVRAVRSLALAAAPDAPPAEREPWLLPIPAGVAPVIDPNSPIRLFRDGVQLGVDRTAVLRRWQPAAELAPSPQSPPTPLPGRRRDLTSFRSLRRQLPAAYGVGPDGLGSNASPERRAQALQLQAYLLIFDQLFSNTLAQLALAPVLLSASAGSGDGQERRYASRAMEDPPFRFGELIDLPASEYAAKLQQWVEPGDPRERRRRFLAHLLARFGEELTPPGADLLSLRREFLADIARMGGARGSGANLLEEAAGAGGFEERLRRKLGLPTFFPQGRQDPPFLVIEHILLRPLPEDTAQASDLGDESIPLLAAVPWPDPWSLRLSLVVNDAPDLKKAAAAGMGNATSSADLVARFDGLVARTFAAELPAQLTPQLLWFGDSGPDEPNLWKRLLEAWRAFRSLLTAYYVARQKGSQAEQTLQLSCRDARDRVIELLWQPAKAGTPATGLGLPWPLRDIPLPPQLVVASGLPATIDLGFSQGGVRYELYDAATGKPVKADPTDPASPVVAALGAGKPIQLTTPRIFKDTIYRVRAIKDPAGPSGAPERATWLRGEIRVIEGIDTSLVPEFRGLPRVDAEAPPQFTARLCDYGANVTVEIPASQDGIEYDLIVADPNLLKSKDEAKLRQKPRQSTASERGNGDTIFLVYPAAAEDLDLQVRASRSTPTAVGAQVDILSTVLSLRVRPNPAVPVEVVKPVRPFAEMGMLQVGSTKLKSQSGVTYQLWKRRIRDGEFVTDPFQPPPDRAAPSVAVAGDGRMIRVASPTPTSDPTALAAMAFITVQAPQVGNGAVLIFDRFPSGFDTTWMVLASKQHRLGPLDGPDPRSGSSRVQLSQVGVQLVRPDPTVSLVLVRWQQDALGGLWRMLGGEPGVFYGFSRGATGLGNEVYLHQKDELNPSVAKGLGQIRLEVDLAIATDPLPGVAPSGEVSPAPLLDLALAPNDLATPLQVRARRATTGLLADLSQPPLLVRVEPPIVNSGSPASIQLIGRPGETYALELGGNRVGAPQLGAGAELKFGTDPLTTTTTFQLVITPQAGGPWRVPVPVRVEA